MLEVASHGRQPDLEPSSLTGEVFGQFLPQLQEHRQLRRIEPGLGGRGRMLAAKDMQGNDRVVGGQGQQAADRRVEMRRMSRHAVFS
ncbi:MAG: hypothetical protein CAPSK01_002277 [Candidatus Accumulibacter vicinus]|uniref:Uncharacterized protein n=1 Tax=Candidatus Accumulibacter vicinus TaxID=2954382 RepID=A0A084Y129_9PROT|nr:MAG: hypothetical protein CAPSK01_002277 [Candidatus Accumulibacter vicinus]